MVGNIRIEAIATAARAVAVPLREAPPSPAAESLLAIELPVLGPPVLGVGGDQRNSVCLTHATRAALWQPTTGLTLVTDDDDLVRKAIRELQERVGVAPVAIAHDLHPGFRSTRWALASGLPVYGVQHHHAHVAACLAEHGRVDRVIGVVLDEPGFGDDGTMWGSVLLEADLGSARRLGSFRGFALADDASAPSAWALAVAALIDAGEDDAIEHVTGATASEIRWCIAAWLAAGATRRATGIDELFAAVAALLGLDLGDGAPDNAGAQLEALAERGFTSGCSLAATPLPYEIVDGAGDTFELELRPTIRAIVDGRNAGEQPACLALRFHATVAGVIAAACRRARKAGAPAIVALTGGGFGNRLLRDRTTELLRADGFEVLGPRRVPCDDRGLSLGQAAVIAYRLARAADE